MGSRSSRPKWTSDGDPPLKTISYRGGLVSFRIPVHWIEEYESDGGGAFYDDAQDSGTLRLQTITAKSKALLSADSAPVVLASLPEAATAPIELLPSGCALIRYTQSVVDRGHRLVITYWSLAQVVPPRYARIFTFSYTLLERQRAAARYRAELDLLDREIRASVFSPELGVTSG
jgi:hypothetical protein